MWSNYFNRDLHYAYVRLLLKDLSPAESFYLKNLRDGIDEQINKSLNWINENEVDLRKLHDVGDWEDFFNDSELEVILVSLYNRNMNLSVKPLSKFYRSGGDLAYNHMGKKPQFLNSDEKALGILSDYVGNVNRSINSEFGLGVKNLIGESIENKDLDNLKQKLLVLRGEPIYSRISVDDRCLFTTKTEYARSVNTGLLQGYSNYGVDEYDWVTSGLSNVCKRCHELENGSPYSLDDIVYYACPHVNCVCSFKAKLPNNIHLMSNPKIIDLTPKK